MKSFKQFLKEDFEKDLKYREDQLAMWNRKKAEARQAGKQQPYLDSIDRNIETWKRSIKALKRHNELQSGSDEDKLKHYQDQLKSLEKDLEDAKFKDTYSGRPSHGGTHLSSVQKQIDNVNAHIQNIQSKK